MEAVKGFIFDRGKIKINKNDKDSKHSYLVSFVLITDEELSGVLNETIIMGSFLENMLTPALDNLPKYKPPHCLGDASHAILTVSNMRPDDLERIKNGSSIQKDRMEG